MDLLAAVAALALAFQIRIHLPVPLFSGLLPGERWSFFGHLWPWVVLAQPLALYLFGLYHPRPERPRLELLRWISFAIGALTLALGAGLFFADQIFPRSVLVLFAGFDILLVWIWRSVWQRLARAPERRVVILGTGVAAVEVAQKIREHHVHGLYVHGHLPLPFADPSGAEESDDGAPVDEALGPRLASIEEVERLHREGIIHDLILVPGARNWRTDLLDRLGASAIGRPTLLLLPGPFESLIGAMRYRWINDLPLIEVTRDSDGAPQPLKRLVDLAGATLLLVLGAPVMVAIAIAVRLSSPGAALFRQERIGRNLEPFDLWKFRTMHEDAERETGEVLAQENDPRLTKVGGFLRRYRLDELPQLWNVLTGSMSLVGPRPERPGFVRRHLEEIPGYGQRFTVAPGLTGLAQVNGEYHTTAENKLRYDLAYIANRSVWIDLSILLRTVRIVLTSQGL
ncbi:MAG: sugar transferase [Thermoanaerobaculia bacterium]